MLNPKSDPCLYLICACLFFISITVQASPQQPFIEIVAHPDGDLILLPSPDSTVIKGMPVMAFRGLPAFGRNTLKLTSDVYSKQQLNGLNRNAARIHSDLMRMKLAAIKPNITRLKNNFKGGSVFKITKGSQYYLEHPEHKLEDQTWYILITRLAAASLTEQSYAQYMCKDKKPCPNYNPKDQSRTPIGTWGGMQANQFEARRAFASFMDKELDKYLAWAEQLNAESEVYFVGTINLPSYAFDKGGFMIMPPRGSGGSLATKMVIPRKQSLVKVNEAEAEKIVERAQGKQLFYVYKAKLTLPAKPFNTQQLIFDQIITSDVIEVFVGYELEDKLFDIPL